MGQEDCKPHHKAEKKREREKGQIPRNSNTPGCPLQGRNVHCSVKNEHEAWDTQNIDSEARVVHQCPGETCAAVAQNAIEELKVPSIVNPTDPEILLQRHHEEVRN